MAFSSVEKYKIIRYLGYPANTIKSGSTSYSGIIYNRLLSLEEDAEDIVIGIITRLESLDTSLSTAVDQSGIKSIDDIEFFGGEGGGSKLQELRKERTRLIKEISGLVDIPYLSSSSMGNVIV